MCIVCEDESNTCLYIMRAYECTVLLKINFNDNTYTISPDKTFFFRLEKKKKITLYTESLVIFIFDRISTDYLCTTT